jgi:hypothetical protein
MNSISDISCQLHPKPKLFYVCAYIYSDQEHDPDDELDVGILNLHTISLISNIEDVGKHNLVPIMRKLELGDDVFLCGTFVSHLGTSKNIPVIRIGHISAMPEEPVDYFSPTRPAYLMDIRYYWRSQWLAGLFASIQTRHAVIVQR